jgi:hypothetical protein
MAASIKFLSETVVKHKLYVRISGRRYLVDNQIEYIERNLARWDNWKAGGQTFWSLPNNRPPTLDDCFSAWGNDYLQARGALVIDEITEDEVRADGSVHAYTRLQSRVTSEADVLRCLEELRDIKRQFHKESTKQVVIH